MSILPDYSVLYPKKETQFTLIKRKSKSKNLKRMRSCVAYSLQLQAHKNNLFFQANYLGQVSFRLLVSLDADDSGIDRPMETRPT